MTIGPDYHELHPAVDRRSPAQAEALYVVVESMPDASVPTEFTARDSPRTAHRLSFTGTGSGPSDLSEKADSYLRGSAFGQPTT